MDKKADKKSGITKIIVSIFLIIFIFLILYAVVSTLKGVSFASTAKGISEFLDSLKSGDGYPYKEDVADIEDIKVLDGKLVVLSNDKTYLLDNTAKKTKEEKHTYLNPALRAYGNKYLVFDRSSGKIRLHNSSEILWEDDLEQNILAADISPDGGIIVATSGDNSKCSMQVFSKKKELLFKWDCSSGYIVDVAISNNGKKYAAAVISEKDAEIISTVYVFSEDSDKPIGEVKFEKSSLFDICFTKGNKIVAMGDNIRSIISESYKRDDDKTFEKNTLANFYVSTNGNTVLQFLKYSGINTNIIVFYNEYGKEICKTEISSSVKRVSCGDNYFAVQCADKVYCYNTNGKKIGEIEAQGYINKIVIIGSKCYIISSGIINKYSVRGSTPKIVKDVI